jgi:hypothetical protein
MTVRGGEDRESKSFFKTARKNTSRVVGCDNLAMKVRQNQASHITSRPNTHSLTFILFSRIFFSLHTHNDLIIHLSCSIKDLFIF